ncbi:MAG: diaminopimelate epimerase [Gemmataceae bacterium]|nr:diaminopimelate epimerase [Gemmataceae bacterium]
MRFTKLHGCGNDYVYVDCFSQTAPADPAELARIISDRHRGVGADGLILILPSNTADARMRMFNADGSEGEMCGNGIRCVAKYVYDHDIARKSPLAIETGRGVLTLELFPGADGRVERVRVDMGEPILDPARVPTTLADIDMPFGPFLATAVSMGNPHAVIFLPDLSGDPARQFGPELERHPAFPQRVNVHFAAVLSRGEVVMQSWERGSGLTQACGTGACAVCVAGVLTGRTDRRLLAHLPGGDLELDWSEIDNHVYMTGPAVEVFSGDWPGS